MRPKSSRLRTRLALIPRGVFNRLKRPGRKVPENPRRILVAHRLLLGDTLLLTPMLARLHRRYPGAEIVMAVSGGYLPLYETRPYAVKAIRFDPGDPEATKPLLDQAPFDLALVPGDNRYAMLALALDSRWVVAMEGDRPGWKNLFADVLIPVPAKPVALSEMFAQLAGEDDGAVFDPRDWPRPEHAPFELPRRDYAVLHVGASSPLKLWEPRKWLQTAAGIARKGLEPVFCSGPGEEGLVAEIDPERRYRSYAGELNLVQLWRLLEEARLFVCLDSGPSHLARLARTPTVTLYGPGSAQLLGPGRFWQGHPHRAVTIADFHCRDQQTLFRREIHWVRRCGRTIRECPSPACMRAIDAEAVIERCESLLR